MKNNQGVTLIELIIVIMIIGILAGGAMLGIRGLDSGNSRSTVKRISALLDYVRVLNMSKDKAYELTIKNDGENFTAVVHYNNSGTDVVALTEELKLNNGTITYNTSTSSYSILPGDENDLDINFTKDAGSILPTPKGDVNRIEITAGGRTYTIHLVKATGKNYID